MYLPKTLNSGPKILYNHITYYIMDTDYQDLATATEVLNKAYQLKQVDKKCYYFLAVILSCHWSKHGHVTKIFCDIATRKSVFHCVLTARSIHLFYDVVFVFNPFAAGATVVLISASTWKGKTERFQSVD